MDLYIYILALYSIQVDMDKLPFTKRGLSSCERRIQIHISASEVLIKNVGPIHSQKRHTLDASCGFYRPDTTCSQLASSLLT